jgi:hypothetical protein
MKNSGWSAVVLMATGLSVALTACSSGGGGGNTTPPPPTTYVLTVNSASPASGVAITVAPADNNSLANGTTSFTRTYNSGAAVTLTAPPTAGGNNFSAWTGCTTTSTVTCNVTLGASTTVTATYAAPPTPYTLTVTSATPNSGVAITVAPADNNAATSGTTSFTRTYNSGTAVTLTAPTTAAGNNFSAWTGCTTTSTVTCNVTISANTAVTATYAAPPVTVTPNPATATIGTQQQFSAQVNGAASTAVTWTVAAPSGSSLSPGTINSTGLYTTPYPAPATVIVTATSTANTSQSGSTTVTLSAPAAATGPALTVNVNSLTGAISPDIYGMNTYDLDTTTATTANLGVVRWGGDNTSRYNYQANTTNSASDYYFQNGSGAGGMWPDGSFNSMVTSAASNGISVLGTVPVLGWVTNSSTTACSFTSATYPGQQSYNGVCGNGIYPDGTGGCTDSGGCSIFGNSTVAALTSISEPPPTPPTAANATAAWAAGTWTGGWVNSLVTKFGPGNPTTGTSKGVGHYDLDNEPAWWDAVHRDVHPVASTYDEVTNGGIGTALAIKLEDPTALVHGPVIDYWWNYFYSKKDIESGWGSPQSGPCYQPWSNPVDREAHGGVPMIEYYLQQFAQAQTTYGARLLDYVDLHTYFAPDYPANSGNSVGFTTAGDTEAQQARLNSTRVFWDPTYTDSSNNFPQPNYTTDPNYTTSCNVPQQAPQLIPMMQQWIAKDYPGTKTAITEYNWGGMESINGALAQADILGIFGRQGLNFATLWPTTTDSTQVPGTMAFAIYRNYDGHKSTFGNTALASTSANQGALSVYGALRTSDNTVTVVVINKTYGDLTDTLSLTGLSTSATTAQAYLYSNANLASIVAQPALTVTPPPSGSAASTIANYTFPAQSITLLVIPQ